jgi:hypothetical protein
LYIELICAFFIISALNYTVSKAHLALKYTKNIDDGTEDPNRK